MGRNELARNQSIICVVFQIESRIARVVYGSVINEGCLKIRWPRGSLHTASGCARVRRRAGRQNTSSPANSFGDHYKHGQWRCSIIPEDLLCPAPLVVIDVPVSRSRTVPIIHHADVSRRHIFTSRVETRIQI